MGNPVDAVFGDNNGPSDPDPRAAAQAQAEANRLTVIGPDGTINQQYGYIDPATGQFIANQNPPEGISAAMRLGESDVDRQQRVARQNIGSQMLNRGQDIAQQLGSGPDSLTQGLDYALPGAQTSDPDAMRQLLYDQQMDLIRPDMEINRRRVSNQLADRGLPMGGEAYRNTMRSLGDQEMRTLSQIAGQATMQGADLAQRNLGNQLNLRNTQIGERELEQNNQLNQLAALLGGAPAFNRQTIAPSPIDVAGNIYASYNSQQQAAQAANANRNNTLGSMFNLGGMLGAAAISDRRLKTNIRQIDTLASGLPWYEFAYVWAPDERHEGVMADEAAQMFPDAVMTLNSGYMAVDYGAIA